MLDQSALTGESMPVRLDRGQDVMSGSTNAGEAFDLRATPPRGGQHLCRDRPAGRGGAEVQGADGPAGRPLFAAVPRRHGRSGDRGLVVHGRSDPRGGGSGRRDAMSA